MPVIALSNAIEGPVDMIKIDVEGFEAEVLQGAAELFERNPNVVVLLEFNPAALFAAGNRPEEILDLLPEQDWDLWLVDERDHVAPQENSVGFDRSGWIQGPANDPGWYANLLATPTTARREQTTPTH